MYVSSSEDADSHSADLNMLTVAPFSINCVSQKSQKQWNLIFKQQSNKMLLYLEWFGSDALYSPV